MGLLKPCGRLQILTLGAYVVFHLLAKSAIGRQRLEFSPRGSLQHDPGIIGQVPEFRIDLTPQLVGGMIPGPPQVQGQIEQGFDACNLSWQVIVCQGGHIRSPEADLVQVMRRGLPRNGAAPAPQRAAR